MLPVHSHDDPNREYTEEQGCDRIIRRIFDRGEYERQGF
jgi:hypothetical protein